MSTAQPSNLPALAINPRDATALDTASPEVVACWSQIGVQGDGTCPELKQHVHCHHCPVFSAAALQLLNRPLSPEYRIERTRHFAIGKDAPEPISTSAVLFRIHAEWLALPTRVFQEVTEKRLIHSLPHRRAGLVLGVANLRGELLICLSLGHLLGMENLPSHAELRRSYHRVLVVHSEGTRLAFLVDEVHGPHRFQTQTLRPVPATLSNSNPGYTQCVIAWQNHSVGLLDPDLLFSNLNRSFA